jgi:hypothetical protein
MRQRNVGEDFHALLAIGAQLQGVVSLVLPESAWRQVLHGRRDSFNDTYLDEVRQLLDADLMRRGISELQGEFNLVPYNRTFSRESEWPTTTCVPGSQPSIMLAS